MDALDGSIGGCIDVSFALLGLFCLYILAVIRGDGISRSLLLLVGLFCLDDTLDGSIDRMHLLLPFKLLPDLASGFRV